jgi:hypothetical protein
MAAVPLLSWPFHRLKEEALVANEAASLSNERRSRLALGISFDNLAIAPITLAHLVGCWIRFADGARQA